MFKEPYVSRKLLTDPQSPDGYVDAHDVALFRYGLVAQLIHDPPPAGQQEALLREIAAKTYQIPWSNRTHVSVSTLRRYLNAYQTGGFEGLCPAPRVDAGKPRAFSEDVLAHAIALREEQPARTTQTLVDILARDETLALPQPLNVHTLTTHLRRRGKTRALVARSDQVYRRFEREAVNELWQADALSGPWLPDPERPGKKRRTTLFCLLDDHSRLVPYAAFFFDGALPRMERVFKLGLLRRGVPKGIYCDNGKVYSSKQFDTACALLGIRHTHTPPYRPEGKGKQERFFETLRAQFLPEVEASGLSTLQELNASLEAWLECVYHRHVHSETGETPWARYSAGLARGEVRPADPELLRRAFLWREKRKVTKTGTLSLQGNRYQVPGHLAGRELELCFDPFDLSQIELSLLPERTPLGTATVLVQTHQRHLQVARLATDPPDPPKPKSSLDFLAALRAEHQAELKRQAGTLHFADALQPPDESDADESDEPDAPTVPMPQGA